MVCLNHLQDIPLWKELTDEEVVRLVKDILIRFDFRFQELGVELMRLGHDDPDANYTPCEHQMRVLAKLFGLDYNKDIVPEAYDRIIKWKTHLDEVHKTGEIR